VQPVGSTPLLPGLKKGFLGAIEMNKDRNKGRWADFKRD
jgi:hypothetical protein